MSAVVWKVGGTLRACEFLDRGRFVRKQKGGPLQASAMGVVFLNHATESQKAKFSSKYINSQAQRVP